MAFIAAGAAGHFLALFTTLPTGIVDWNIYDITSGGPLFQELSEGLFTS
jgi:hypothetical protein